uniref:Jupiter microtubule associated homolog 1 n=1 Tax=Terrapene triunguis TaxID=2587831 RepID=A0A674JM08_9SAUR
ACLGFKNIGTVPNNCHIESFCRVLRPPGGGSNFNLSFDLPKEQPVRRNKMASNIFGLPEENPISRAGSTGAMPGGVREDSEPSGPQRINASDANCGDFVDPKVTENQSKLFGLILLTV